MNDAVFQYDVFLSHSANGKAVVRPLHVASSRKSAANSSCGQETRENEDGGALPGRRYAEKPASGVAHPNTFRFRNPLNQERRFIPLRLDYATIAGCLAQFGGDKRMLALTHCSRWN